MTSSNDQSRDAAPISFWANTDALDYVILESLFPVEHRGEVRVVGAARSHNQVVLVPLTEISVGSRTEPRRIRLHIPPMIGMKQFSIPRHPTPFDAERIRSIWQYLALVGVDFAFLHADIRGNPDVDNEGAMICDPRTGQRMFRALDRTSPANDVHGLRLLVAEAYNFERGSEILELAGDDMRPPPLFGVHIRALAAALDGVARLIEASRAPSGERNGT